MVPLRYVCESADAHARDQLMVVVVQLFLGRQWVNSIKIELEIDLTRTQHGALARKKDRKCLPGDKKLWDGPKLENGEN